MRKLSLAGAREVAADHERLATVIGVPFADWSHQCHAISLALARSGEFGRCRVARGVVNGVTSQHSWIVLGDDCYDPAATLVDPTLWSYQESVTGILVGRASKLDYHPHGRGSIWEYGRPDDPTGPIIELTPAKPLSPAARQFLNMLGPLDHRGWAVLIHSPVGGWPAAEIIAAIDDTRELSALIPIDILGMLTDRNPRDLYLSKR